MKDKKFDAVRMMREIRDKLSKRYNEDPEAERRDLQDVRRRYGIKDMNCDLCINDCGLSLKITTDNSFLYLRYNERKKSGQ